MPERRRKPRQDLIEIGGGDLSRTSAGNGRYDNGGRPGGRSEERGVMAEEDMAETQNHAAHISTHRGSKKMEKQN